RDENGIGSTFPAQSGIFRAIDALDHELDLRELAKTIDVAPVGRRRVDAALDSFQHRTALHRSDAIDVASSTIASVDAAASFHSLCISASKQIDGPDQGGT